MNLHLIVTLFVDMPIENQAMTFAVINLEPTKVNKSLAYDLYEYAKSRRHQERALEDSPIVGYRRLPTPFLGKRKLLDAFVDHGLTHISWHHLSILSAVICQPIQIVTEIF